ncbi:hypothetical protein CC85DRAFT_289249 [Cutaneotrichosporon oleaginosum]|uniref:Uncharacterized protein n=1 Tax=Cutaneotrichosporon oleaginosum TaxID=879819 RepID=A0A0J1ATT3_9TREE|nr:uncharacterized protein CC85DRAFT_289249 [Cutaneotrichosporon oleaginosum]KLT38739.1 hypothetical protein CC85DRAFT_289249 [Cutaneotrichosporon oleaginosum]TXT06905.1 hypothetical protein COLE_06236 [Cutaneotrichosporon oleaginosum]
MTVVKRPLPAGKRTSSKQSCVTSPPRRKASLPSSGTHNGPTSRPLLTLDHTAFPHIMDGILTHATHGTLLSLRAASRAWRARVDAVLHKHVSIATDHIPRAGSSGSGSGTLPLHAAYAAPVDTLDLLNLTPPGFTPPTSPSIPFSRRPVRSLPFPPLPPSVNTLRIIGDLDWARIGPRLPSCATLVVLAPLPLIEPSIYTPRLSTPRGLADSAACAAYLARCPRLVLPLSALRGASVYMLADVLRARKVVLLADDGEWRDALAALCCLLGAVLLNRATDTRFTLVNVLEAGTAWRRTATLVPQGDAVDVPSDVCWDEEGFWADGMGLFRLAGHEFAHSDAEVRARMEKSVEFLSSHEYEARVGDEVRVVL